MLGSEFFRSLHSLPDRVILGALIWFVVYLEFRTPSRDVTPRDDVTPRGATSPEFRTTSPEDFRALSVLVREVVRSPILLFGIDTGRETRLVLVITGEFECGRERRELSMERRRSIRRTLADFWLWEREGERKETSSEKGSSRRGKVGEGADTTDMELSHRSTNRPAFSLQLRISLRLGMSNMDRGTGSDEKGMGEGSDMLRRIVSIVSSISVCSGSCSFIVSWSDTMQIVRFIWCFLGSWEWEILRML